MSKKTNKRQSTRRLRRVLNSTQEMVTRFPMRTSRFQYGAGMPIAGVAKVADDSVDLVEVLVEDDPADYEADFWFDSDPNLLDDDFFPQDDYWPDYDPYDQEEFFYEPF